MSTQLTWLGHATWLIESGDHSILLDPFLTDSPAAPVKAEEVNPNTILVSHGHFDHIADVAGIASRSGAHVVAIFEIAEWLKSKHGIENATGMNLGGRLKTDFLQEGKTEMSYRWMTGASNK